MTDPMWLQQMLSEVCLKGRVFYSALTNDFLLFSLCFLSFYSPYRHAFLFQSALLLHLKLNKKSRNMSWSTNIYHFVRELQLLSVWYWPIKHSHQISITSFDLGLFCIFLKSGHVSRLVWNGKQDHFIQ